jgi:membrane peptidoglycan carboxypeptidase
VSSRVGVSPRAAAPARPAPRRRRLLGIVKGLVLLGLALAVLGAGSVALLWPLTPSVADAGARVGALLAAHSSTPLAALPSPDPVGRAIIATENSRFNSDFGVDAISLLRTALGMVTGSADQGAATLEDQLAKNLYTDRRSGLRQEIEQVELSFKLDARFTKQQVLLLYLNAAYFGHGNYGLAAAARNYFGVPPGQLSWAQASLLAGLVQAPTAYDPYHHLDLAKIRQRHVLNRLVATKVLTPAQADAAYAAPLGLRAA